MLVSMPDDMSVDDLPFPCRARYTWMSLFWAYLASLGCDKISNGSALTIDAVRVSLSLPARASFKNSSLQLSPSSVVQPVRRSKVNCLFTAAIKVSLSLVLYEPSRTFSLWFVVFFVLKEAMLSSLFKLPVCWDGNGFPWTFKPFPGFAILLALSWLCISSLVSSPSKGSPCFPLPFSIFFGVTKSSGAVYALTVPIWLASAWHAASSEIVKNTLNQKSQWHRGQNTRMIATRTKQGEFTPTCGRFLLVLHSVGTNCRIFHLRWNVISATWCWFRLRLFWYGWYDSSLWISGWSWRVSCVWWNNRKELSCQLWGHLYIPRTHRTPSLAFSIWICNWIESELLLCFVIKIKGISKQEKGWFKLPHHEHLADAVPPVSPEFGPLVSPSRIEWFSVAATKEFFRLRKLATLDTQHHHITQPNWKWAQPKKRRRNLLRVFSQCRRLAFSTQSWTGEFSPSFGIP